MKNKTVYILGAGFSADAKAPMQNKIVEEVFKLNDSKSYLFKQKKINQFKIFLSNTLFIQKNLHSSIPLEDIFTPLDRCIADNISFRNLDINKVKEIREVVYYLIGVTLKELLSYNIEKDYISKFAQYLFDNCIDRKNLGYKDNYSLPQADFEMRQLLSRMIRENAEIEVVTREQSNNDLKNRYEVFFGKRKPKLFYEGVTHYINNNLE